MSEQILACATSPIQCISSYCKHNGLIKPQILNQLKITADTAHLADYAVKWAALDRNFKTQRVFVAFFRRPMYSGIYLTGIKEIKLS